MRSPSDETPVVVLALEGLDWTLLQQLADRGLAPHLAQLIEDGAWAPLALSPATCRETLWTTLATGHSPRRHGVLHPLERVDGTLFCRAVDARSIRVPAVWQLACDAGRHVACIGWPLAGGLAGERLLRIAPGAEVEPASPTGPWPLDPASVHPRSALATARELRLRAGELPVGDLGFFLSALSRESRRRIDAPFAQALARASTRHAWGTHALANAETHEAAWPPVDLLAVHLPLLAEADQLLSTIPDDAGCQATRERLHQFVDLLVGRYMALAGRGARFLVIGLGAPARTTPDAFVLASGRGIVRDRMFDPLPGSEVADLVLALAGAARSGRTEAAAVDAFFEADAAPRRHVDAPPPPRDVVPADFPDDLASLPGDGDLAAMAFAPSTDWAAFRVLGREVRQQTLAALALAAQDDGEADEALAILRLLCAEPDAPLSAYVALARLLVARRLNEEFDAVVDAGRRAFGEGPLSDAAEAARQFMRRDWPALDTAIDQLLRQGNRVFNLRLLAARSHQARAAHPAAIAWLGAALADEPRNADAWEALGDSHAALGNDDEAARAYGRAVGLRPGVRGLLMKLSDAHGRRGDRRAATQALLRATLARDAAAR